MARARPMVDVAKVATWGTIGLLAGLAARRRRFSLSGRNALVTGGARGLGLEIARVLVKKGASVCIVARDEAEIARAVMELRRMSPGPGVRVIGEPCDLRDGAALDAMLEAVRARLGPVDVLVNNAGTIEVGPLDTTTIGDFEDELKLHCFAPLRTMLGLRPTMRRRGGGRVANVASIGGAVSVPHLLPYSTSKFALVGLSRGMHAELARDNIVVSTILPGLMRTGSPRRATFRGDHAKEYAWFSISDSLPGLTVSSARAARRIVRAIERGEPNVVIGLPAKIAAIAAGIAPGLVMRALAIVNSVLPGGSDRTPRLGFESESVVAPSFLTSLSERAAARNNEG